MTLSSLWAIVHGPEFLTNGGQGIDDAGPPYFRVSFAGMLSTPGGGFVIVISGSDGRTNGNGFEAS